MKRSPWFYLSIIAIVLGVLFFLTACTKSNITFKHHFRVQEAHDRTTWDHAFCDSSAFGKIDTVELDNTAEYDSTKFGIHAGSILFHIPNGRVETDIPGIYDRYYFKVLEMID